MSKKLSEKMDFQVKFYCMSLIPMNHLCSKSCVETIYRKKFGGRSYMLREKSWLKLKMRTLKKWVLSENFFSRQKFRLRFTK